MSPDWTRQEVEAIVADYFAMLDCDLRGEPYSKTEHRRRLAPRLPGRSAGSVEWKHQNISAALRDLGFPYIPGYKPRRNYQQLLFDIVAERLGREKRLDEYVRREVETPTVELEVADVLKCLVPPPSRARGREQAPAPDTPEHLVFRRGSGVDYFARESMNAALGLMGEKLVVQFEQERLRQEGGRRLAEKVEHISRTRGDGLGFDVLSWEVGGEERFIEVKTTRYAIETPFYATRNEVEVSRERRASYHLYRVFEYRRSPRIFTVRGALDTVCTLQPAVYLGTVP